MKHPTTAKFTCYSLWPVEATRFEEAASRTICIHRCLNSKVDQRQLNFQFKISTLAKKKGKKCWKYIFCLQIFTYSTNFFTFPLFFFNDLFFGFAFIYILLKAKRKRRERKGCEALKTSCIIFQNKTYWLKGRRKPFQIAEIFHFCVPCRLFIREGIHGLPSLDREFDRIDILMPWLQHSRQRWSALERRHQAWKEGNCSKFTDNANHRRWQKSVSLTTWLP